MFRLSDILSEGNLEERIPRRTRGSHNLDTLSYRR